MSEKLVILGGGESGIGSAVLGVKQGFDVFVSDAGTIAEEVQKELNQLGVSFEEGGHDLDVILKASLVMKSPGIPDHIDLIQQIRSSDIKIVSEIEFASQYTDATLIGITGSNGKTTTTLLTHHLLKESGINVGVAGNIGYSFARQVAESDREVYVLEISSFQLDDIHKFQPEVAVITNITPDHLDRYENNFSKYVASKMRIIENQTSNQFLVFNAEDPVLVEALNGYSSKVQIIPFGFVKPDHDGVYATNDQIIVQQDNSNMMIQTTHFQLQGRHNLLNAMAAVSVARLLKVSKDSIRESLMNFKGAPHRLEQFLRIQSVNYINDSKATNVNATFYALDSVKSQTVWIAGGIDKGNDYSALLPMVREKVKAIICLGVDNKKLLAVFGPVVDIIVETRSIDEAVKIAHKIAGKKETVLLSPACASFDLFEDYEDRGNQFKQAVQKL
ncbi:UDP-N-acetylmuramoyl-L-alanine--D-glutamate ligase [Flavobacteriaceae bacterium]|nr:UDP-N-acetylmuramoyl-L-alanine--D-glutamate ligase [Flavobacteriaceae bacterium]MDB9910632.1 UDP-N-acetylmuramoyl-L-alanine--D-glutamate ligase [Flavobacteriaceae bacterium]